MAHKTKLTSVSTWGRKEKESWVKKYNLLYSIDGESWIVYGENGFPKVPYSKSLKQKKVASKSFIISASVDEQTVIVNSCLTI